MIEDPMRGSPRLWVGRGGRIMVGSMSLWWLVTSLPIGILLGLVGLAQAGVGWLAAVLLGPLLVSGAVVAAWLLAWGVRDLVRARRDV